MMDGVEVHSHGREEHALYGVAQEGDESMTVSDVIPLRMGMLQEGAKIVPQHREDVDRYEPKNWICPPGDKPSQAADQRDLPSCQDREVPETIRLIGGCRSDLPRGHLLGPEHIQNGCEHAGEPDQERYQRQTIRLIEAAVSMPVRIRRRSKVVMVIEVISLVDSSNCADRPEDHDVVKKVVPPATVEEASMEPIVANQMERVVSSSYDDRSWKRQPPIRPVRDDRPAGKYRDPA
jgi:hypothetical protein